MQNNHDYEIIIIANFVTMFYQMNNFFYVNKLLNLRPFLVQIRKLDSIHRNQNKKLFLEYTLV